MHEFNNHHAVVLSSFERLTLQGPLTDKQRETIGRGIEAVDRATNWIRRLRRNLPPHSVQLTHFNLRDFLIRFFQHQHPELQTKLPTEALPYRVGFDPRDLNSILDNILQALTAQGVSIQKIDSTVSMKTSALPLPFNARAPIWPSRMTDQAWIFDS